MMGCLWCKLMKQLSTATTRRSEPLTACQRLGSSLKNAVNIGELPVNW